MPQGVAGLPIRREFELGRRLTGCTRRRCSLRRAVIAAVAIILLGHNIHGDMHASHICGGRQQRSRVLAVARYGLAPCPRTKTHPCLGIDEAISAPRTALLLPIESLQSRLSFSCASPPEATVA